MITRFGHPNWIAGRALRGLWTFSRLGSGLARVYFFENLYVPFVFEVHDCGGYCRLLFSAECENVFHVADNAFIAEYSIRRS